MPAAMVSAQYSYIYRSDNKFNSIDLRKEVRLQHKVGPSDTMLTFNGDTIPLAAIEYIDFRKTDVPTLRFTVAEQPDMDWVTEKDKFIDAIIDIEGAGTVDDAYDLELSVKGRGNSTWNMPKKPMRLKFNKKTSICGFEKAKNYVLLANYIDDSHMRNAIGLWLARRLGMEFSNSTMPCNVYFNDHYKGLYLLTEKIGINKASVNIDESKGVLFEASNEFDEQQKFRSEVFNLPIMIKAPDFGELCEADTTGGPDATERLRLWQDDYNRAELAIKEGRGNEVVDIQSAVDYFLVMNFANNSEIGFPKSVYFYKRDLAPESLYYFGPIWDLDVAFNHLTSSTEMIENSPENGLWYFLPFCYLEDLPEFQELYRSRLSELASTIFPELLEWVADYADFIEPAARLDGLRWNETEKFVNWVWRTSSFDTRRSVAGITDWMIRRLNYLLADAGLESVDTEVANANYVSDVTTETTGMRIHAHDGSLYALELTDGLEIKMADGLLSVESTTEPVYIEIGSVTRIDYGPITESDLSEVSVADARIKLNEGKLTIVPVAESLVEVLNMSGQRVISTMASLSGIEIDLSHHKAQVLIVTLNHRPLCKVRL